MKYTGSLQEANELAVLAGGDVTETDASKEAGGFVSTASEQATYQFTNRITVITRKQDAPAHKTRPRFRLQNSGNGSVPQHPQITRAFRPFVPTCVASETPFQS